MSFPVALQLFSVRDSLEVDFEGTLKKVKELGFQGVEFAGLYGREPEAVKSLLEELGLEPVSAHISIDELLDDTEGVLEAYKKIGCKYVAIPYIVEDRRPGAERWEKTVEDIKKIAIVAKSKGIQLMYHNHDFEFVKINGKFALDELYDTISADLLETEIDTCWANVAGVDPAAYVRQYTGRATILHFKDFTGGKTENMYELIGIESDKPKYTKAFEFRPIGYGKQDIPTLLEAAEAAGTKWLVVEQDHPSMGKTSLECAQMSINYLKTLL
ncbi:MAG: sugar phosphate isomerase/epimerase [Ruminococcaceae bacterium]|nr:sugar phosphate isomerase/epimerase [Oscillospiraceae bacterium]